MFSPEAVISLQDIHDGSHRRSEDFVHSEHGGVTSGLIMSSDAGVLNAQVLWTQNNKITPETEMQQILLFYYIVVCRRGGQHLAHLDHSVHPERRADHKSSMMSLVTVTHKTCIYWVKRNTWTPQRLWLCPDPESRSTFIQPEPDQTWKQWWQALTGQSVNLHLQQKCLYTLWSASLCRWHCFLFIWPL